MINYFQAQRIASKNDVPAEIIEKDFFIEFILFYLVRDSYFKEKLIFRGGTALKKIYFPDYRYSEDLDFLIQEREEIRRQEQRVNQIIEKINSEYPFQLNKRAEYSEDRLQLYLSYNIIPEIRAIKELKIDLLKDSIIPTFHRRNILWGYQEFIQETAKLNTYIFESIISDKICRILDVDNEPRDIYDLWYLLKLNLDVLKIKKELKRRFGYDIHLSNLLSGITNEDFKRNWQLRLEKQVRNLPAYEIVIEELKKSIKEKIFPNKK